MAKNYWMFVETEENASITRSMNYQLFGMGPKYRKLAQRMQPKDRVIFYIRKSRMWTASGTIISKYFEDASAVWQPETKKKEFMYRVNIEPNYVLEPDQYINGSLVGPSLDYVKKWYPEHWHLAFWESLHLIPQKDFSRLEDEMIRLCSPINEIRQ